MSRSADDARQNLVFTTLLKIEPNDRFASIDGCFDLRGLIGIVYSSADRESRLDAQKGMILHRRQCSKDRGQVGLPTVHDNAGLLLDDAGAEVQKGLYSLHEDFGICRVVSLDRCDDLHHKNTDLLARVLQVDGRRQGWRAGLLAGKDL